MTVSISSPVTGSAQTGLTSPTYTLANDVAPDNNGKQWAVTALGGTQTGVSVHSVSSPFTTTFVRPRVLRALPDVNSVGRVVNVPNNVYRLITRKGVIPLAGQASRTMIVETLIHVPAGSDAADSEDIRAALSLHIGSLTQQSAGIGDTCATGVI